MVTLAGDLGTASNYFMTHGWDGWGALMNEGHSDLRGDVDGLNLSVLLSNSGWSGATPVASALTAYYYGSGPETYLNRGQFFRDTSEYVTNLGVFGYVSSAALHEDVQSVAFVFSIDGIFGAPSVVQAFDTWLGLEVAGLNP